MMYDELMEALRLCVKYGKTEDALANAQKAADAIEKLIEVIQNHDFLESLIKPRWIPVTERLPETQESILGKKSSKVIVAFHFDDGTQGTDTAHTLNGKWVFEDHIVVVARTITHWMPLPKPPKEEEND